VSGSDAHLDASDEALSESALALYAAGDLDGCLSAWERLHARCAASGDRLGAARAAIMVAQFLLIDTALMASVRTWLLRAADMLRDEPPGAVHALLAMLRAYERLFCGDVEAVETNAVAAIELGDRFGVAAASVIGRIARARVLVLTGSLEDGLRALDEAGARLRRGEVDPLTTGIMLCEIVCAAQGMMMPELAREWTDVMHRWREGLPVGGIHGRCRVHRAELLRLSGPSDVAEAEALMACDELQPWMRREYGWPLAELGTIRLRRGDLARAEEAFGAAHALAWTIQPGLSLLRLAQGDTQAAAELIADAISHPDTTPWKEQPPVGELRLAPLLDAQAEIAVAAGDVATCGSAAAQLVDIARKFPSRGLAASAAVAGARAALLRAELDRARQLASDAAAAWADLGAPYESAAALVVAADASWAAGNASAAAMDWSAAKRAFDEYGAVLRAREVQQRLDQATAPSGGRPGVAAFRREGKVRVIRYAGPGATVPDLVGFRHLERLIRARGRGIACEVLVASGRGGAPSGQAGLPVLDRQAVDAYRRRLAEIDEDILDAEAAHDLVRATLARRDREFLVAELSRGVGLHGRLRETASDAERARTSVFRAIKYAVDRINEIEPDLAEHLRRSIRTGALCSYSPDPTATLRWDL
jgi:hypothetical protein